MLHRLFLSMVFGLFSGLSTAQAGIFNPKSFTLKNGMQVVVLENHRAPVVTQVVYYKVGSADDPCGKSGLAHFLEHLMFKGKPNSASISLSPTVTRLGGELNAATGDDFTFYYETVASQYLETMMKLESGRLRHLDILPPHVETERHVILEERRMRIENEPVMQAVEATDLAYYVRHPYRIPGIGWENEIQSASSKELETFHKIWYQPQNALLIIAGDVTFSQVKTLAEKYYGTISNKGKITRARLQEPGPRKVAERLTYPSEQIQNPYFYRLYPAPHPSNADLKEIYALEILNSFLTRPGTGLFYRHLVEEKRIASDVSLSYSDFSLNPRPLSLGAEPLPGHSLEELENALETEIKEFLKKGISPEEVEKTKNRLLASLIYAKDNAFGGAHHFGEGLSVDRTLAELDQWDEHIKAVTSEEVNKVAHRIFENHAHVTTYVVPHTPKKEKKDHE